MFTMEEIEQLYRDAYQESQETAQWKAVATLLNESDLPRKQATAKLEMFERVFRDNPDLARLRIKQLAREPVRFFTQTAFLALVDALSGKTPLLRRENGNLISEPLSHHGFRYAMDLMESFTDEQGRRLSYPDTLVVGYHLQTRAERILRSYPGIELVVSPYLSGTPEEPFHFIDGHPGYTANYNWFLLETVRPITKPIVIVGPDDTEFAIERKARPTSKLSADVILQVKSEYAVGYGKWCTAVGSNATG